MEFSHNARTDVWESSADFRGTRISVQISSNHPSSERSRLVTDAIARTIAEWDRIQANITDSLHETYNDGWADPDEGLPELSRDAFLERITLQTIYVREEGAVSLYFDDSDLFAGHIVDVFWTEEKMYEASLMG